MLNQIGIAALNHLLDQSPWAREKLARYAGASARLHLVPLDLPLVVSAEGWLAEAAGGPFDVEIELPALAAARLAAGDAAAMQEAAIRGQADFAEALGFVLRHLRWDAEADLARLFGDVAGHRLAGTAAQLGGDLRLAALRSGENLAEYLKYESALLVAAPELRAFCDEVDALRDRLARLEARLARIASGA